MYRIQYSSDTIGHFRWLSAGERSVLLDAVEEHLSFQPTVPTRNRKPLRPNSLAAWELRVADCRVFYEVSEQPEPLVTVLAIGLKIGSRLVIGGEDVAL
jgi:mRNA-degrading endonuclease RelE of RelBE toxin-antitoxin system